MKQLFRWILILALIFMGLLVAACGSAPLRWWFKSSPQVAVQVLDKTVPQHDYREHAALYWVLRHEKVPAVDGSTDWPLSDDYRGFHPAEDPGVPPHGAGDELGPGDVSGARLLYLADSYGVYEGDFAAEGETALDYSPLLYGGMNDREVDVVEDFVAAGGDLVAEFNTFASPTGGSARGRLETLLGLDWSGWSGRYFPDLADDNEVPAWAPRFWLENRGAEWDFRGPGYLLVHEDTRIVVLRSPQDVTYPGLVLQVTSGHPLMANALSGVRFGYWFDIVAPRPGSTVAASFRFAPTESGRAALNEFGLPVEFPAVVVASEEPLRMYFAGDFADAGTGLGPHWAEGLPWLNRSLIQLWFPRDLTQEPFYWGFYIPVVRTMLERYERD